MNNNLKLYNLRKERNLSLKEASKLINIKPLTLKNLEEGYLKIRPKYESKIIQGYNLNNNFFVDDKNYVSSINEETTNEKKINNIFIKILKSTILLIISIFILITSSITSFYTLNYVNSYSSNPIYFYNENFQNVYNNIYSNGYDDLLSLNYILYDTDAKTLCYEINNTFIDYKVPEDKRFPNIFYINSYEFNEEYDYLYDLIIDTYIDSTHFNLEGSIYKYKDLYTLEFQGILTNEYEVKISYFTLTDSLENTEYIDENHYLYQEISIYFNEFFNLQFKKIQEGFKKINNDQYEFKEIFSEYLFEKAYLEQKYGRMHIYSFLSLFSLATSICLILINLYLRIKEIYKKYKEKKESKYLLKEKLYFDLTKDLPIDLKYGPFLKEGILKIFSVFFLLFCSLGLGIEVFTGFNLYDNIHLSNYLYVASLLYTVSYFLVFFLKLNSTITNKNVFLSALGFLYLGIIFNLLEIELSMYLENEGYMYEMILNYLPTNIFWGLGIFMFMTTFLFMTPSFIDRYYKRVIYRLLSLIPLFYLIISKVILNTLEIDNNLKYLLIDEDINIIIFATLMIYSIYFLRFYYKRKYKRGYLSYFNGNRYLLTKNIVISLIVVLIIILNLFLSRVQNFEAIGFKNDLTLLILIPFILIYKERLPKSNTIQGALYTISTTLANSISYIMIGAYILLAPYL